VTIIKVITNFRYQWTQLLVTIYQHQKLYLLKTYGILMAYLLGSFGKYRTLIYLARIKLICCNSVNLNGLLYNLPRINKIETCFSQSSRSTDVVDLWEFINWNNFVPRTYGAFLTSQYRHDYGCYNFKARVSL